jgi:phosphatidylglycerophosphatase A
MYILLIYGQWWLIQNIEYSVKNGMWIAVDDLVGGSETRLITEYVEH